MVIVKDGITHKMELMSIKIQVQTAKLDHIAIQIMGKNAHKFFWTW